MKREEMERERGEREALVARDAAPSGADGGLEEAASLGSVPELLEFVREHPDVNELPPEVLEKLKKGKKLMQAYAEYESERLRDELAAERQNRKNSERSPGSVSSAGGDDSELEELLAVFDSVFK